MHLVARKMQIYGQTSPEYSEVGAKHPESIDCIEMCSRTRIIFATTATAKRRLRANPLLALRARLSINLLDKSVRVR